MSCLKRKEKSLKINKTIIFFLALIFVIPSCGETFDSVKRGLTGAKKNSTDEFLIRKKDPLILPPDFEDLPTPDERIAVTEEISIFKDAEDSMIEENSSTSSRSVEESILKKIRKK